MSTTISIVIFNTEDEANAAIKRMQKAEKDHLIEVEDAVLVTKNQEGKVHVKEYKDFTTRRGAIAGGAIGIVVGAVLGGPVGAAIAAGAGGRCCRRVRRQGRRLRHFQGEDRVGWRVASMPARQPCSARSRPNIWISSDPRFSKAPASCWNSRSPRKPKPTWTSSTAATSATPTSNCISSTVDNGPAVHGWPVQLVVGASAPSNGAEAPTTNCFRRHGDRCILRRAAVVL